MKFVEKIYFCDFLNNVNVFWIFFSSENYSILLEVMLCSSSKNKCTLCVEPVLNRNCLLMEEENFKISAFLTNFNSVAFYYNFLQTPLVYDRYGSHSCQLQNWNFFSCFRDCGILKEFRSNLFSSVWKNMDKKINI